MENKRTRIIGQGAAAMDTILYCDAFPVGDTFSIIKKERLASGGSAANVLVTAAGLGAKAALVAQVGDDALGRQFRRDLVADDVDDRYLFEKKGGVTIHTYIVVGPDGQRAILVNQGSAFHALQAEELPDGILGQGDILYTDGSPGAISERLANQAVKKGVPLFFQIENLPSQFMSTAHSSGHFEYVLSHADLVSAGGDVFEELSGKAGPSAMVTVYEKYRPRLGVILTAGARGAYWFDGTGMRHQEAFKITAIDSTGAGDAFCGGMLFAFFMQGYPADRALRFAAACGAMKCLREGPRFKASAEEVEQFMENHGI